MTLADLSGEFPRDAISWRCQTVSKAGDKGLALAYIDARDVMRRLDAVCGIEGWQDRYEVHGSKTLCYLSVKVGSEWITKADGAGDTDVEAEKGSLSDAFKRAAVKWGIGRYLYDVPAPWVPCETYEHGGKKRWSKWTADPWSCVRQPSRPTPPAASRPALVAAKPTGAWDYVTLAKTAMLNAESKAELTAWWRGEAENREKHGVVKGTDEYDILADAFKTTAAKFPADNLMAAG